MIDKFSKNINKISVILFLLILLISLYSINILNSNYKENESIHSIDNALLLTKNLLEEEQWHALSLSILLSQDKEFLKAFYNKNRQSAFDIINEKIKTLKNFQNYNFEVQVHDENINTYLRNWDFNITNVPLSSFREGLVLARKRKKPLVSIENGKRLNIKAISPILKDGKFIGSIEVIEGFEHLRKRLLEHGYILFVLLDKDYYNSASPLLPYQDIQNKFVLVNESYENNSYNALKNAKLSELKNYGYFTQDKFYFGYFEIKNFSNKKLGYCVVALQNTNPIYIQNHYKYKVIQNNSSKVIIR